MLRFREKSGKSREHPVRFDLQRCIPAYVEAAGISGDAITLACKILMQSNCGFGSE